MNTFEGRCQELEMLSKNWKTDKLFISEAQKLIDDLAADASLLLTTGCDAADLNAHIRILKSVLAAQETWLWTQREALLGAQETTPPAGVQWVM